MSAVKFLECLPGYLENILVIDSHFLYPIRIQEVIDTIDAIKNKCYQA